jgi:hypothetical protein
MLFYVRRHTGADGSLEWYVPQWPYPVAREQILSDESGGCSGAGEVAGEARPTKRSKSSGERRKAEGRTVQRPVLGAAPAWRDAQERREQAARSGPPASYPSSPPGYPTEGEGELAGRAVSQRVGGGTAQRTWPGKRNLTCEPSRWLLSRKRRGAQTKAPPVRAGLCN